MARLAALVYGRALFELALSENQINDMEKEIQFLEQVFRENKKLVFLLSQPQIVREEKIRLIEKIFKDSLSEEMLGFLCILIKNGRFLELSAILTDAKMRINKQKKHGSAVVISAIELNERQKEKIEKRLLSLSGYRTIEIEYQTDVALIAGLIIRMDDRVVDSSVRTQLNEMKKTLIKLQIQEQERGVGAS